MLIDADKLSETKKYHTVGTIPKSNIKICSPRGNKNRRCRKRSNI